jgi:hypothetical protein
MIHTEAWPKSPDKAASLVPDLNLDIHLGGRKAHAIGAEVLRELTASDLGLLATERSIQPTHVQRITERHHALARCLATGMSATEAGLCTGYTASRISVLRGDPSFEELIAFYTQAKDVKVRDLNEKLVDVASEAAAILLDRMDLDPDKLNEDFLLDAVKVGADRTGFGPKQTNVNVNVNMGDKMKIARERATLMSPSLAPSGTVVDGEFTEVEK